jgi:hypothetical protein
VTARKPPGADNATHNTVEYTEPISHPDHPFRSPRPLLSTVQRVSTLLREGVVWGHPSLLAALFGAQLTHTSLLAAPCRAQLSANHRSIYSDQSRDSLL